MPYKTREEKNAQAARYREANRELLRERSRLYRSAHPEAVAAGNARWYAEHAEEQRAKGRAQSREYRLSHRTEVRETGRRWYEENKERRLAVARRWHEEHAPRAAALGAARNANVKAARLGQPDRLAADEVEALWSAQPTCQSCGRPVHGLDHIVGFERGGSNTRANIQNLCPPCNTAKSNRERRGETRKVA
jgi:5-methylcytosine-specific restriction endonuclease McrA